MIEQIVRDYLSAALTNVPVACEIPSGPPPRYIVIEKTGSSERNGIDRATIAVQSIGETMFDAMTLNMQVKTKMAGLCTLTNIFKCQRLTDYNYTDPRRKQHRYQAVFEIVYKEA